MLIAHKHHRLIVLLVARPLERAAHLASPVLLAARIHYWVIKHHTVPLAVRSPCATFHVPL
jgi:hypothetical protein